MLYTEVTKYLCYVDCLLYFPSFVLVRKQILSLSNIQKMLVNISQKEILKSKSPMEKSKAKLFDLFWNDIIYNILIQS